MSAVGNSGKQTTTLVHNIGTLVSGDIENPVLDAGAVLVREGLITEVGPYEKLKDREIDQRVDIQGMTLCPGLIDTHTHILIGDWAPRIKVLGWMESMLHGGVTTLISQGETLFPGRPQDAAGVKALAILACKTYATYRPGGIKVHAGALLLEEGLTEADIEEMARAGVWLLAEIGLGGLKDFPKILALARAARKHGFKIPVHFGPEAIPGTLRLPAEDIVKLDPDVIVHLNGGPTANPFSEMKKVIEDCPAYLEFVYTGNPRAVGEALKLIRERGELRRVILGTDTPTGQGIMPWGILKLAVQIASLNGVPPAAALAFATGNAARAYSLNTGLIRPGKEADLIVIDAPPGSQGKTALEAMSIGDTPALGMIMVDGKVIARTSKRMLPTTRKVLINGEPEPKRPLDEILF
ncbi:MAG: amidohydrolase family protein [Chloroflexi bacterium]|nr:amidohydrolase family protein [Chloroflexota bacterium]